MIPSQLVIGGNNWTIRLQDEVTGDDGDKLEGLCEHSLHTITISSALAEQRQKETLVHETLHALSDFIGIDGKLTEEEFVTRISPVLTLFLDQNGWQKN